MQPQLGGQYSISALLFGTSFRQYGIALGTIQARVSGLQVQQAGACDTAPCLATATPNTEEVGKPENLAESSRSQALAQ